MAVAQLDTSIVSLQELAKTLKVVKLKDGSYGRDYLTACDDKVSIALCKRNSDGWKKNTSNWRIEWLNPPRPGCSSLFVAGKARLWSIYNKALCLEGDPADSNAPGLSQKALDGHETQNAAAEWYVVVIKRKGSDRIYVNLVRRSDKHNQAMRLQADLLSKHPSIKFCDCSQSPTRTEWVVEVVELENEDQKKTAIEALSTPSNHQFQMMDFPRLQVGQVQSLSFYMFTAPYAAVAHNNPRYNNSGGNVNASGIQKNGNVLASCD